MGTEFTASMTALGGDVSTMPPASMLLLVIFITSLIVGPTLNGLFGFGEELGWRGYLLPKPMPLGEVRAYLPVGYHLGPLACASDPGRLDSRRVQRPSVRRVAPALPHRQPPAGGYDRPGGDPVLAGRWAVGRALERVKS